MIHASFVLHPVENVMEFSVARKTQTCLKISVFNRFVGVLLVLLPL